MREAGLPHRRQPQGTPEFCSRSVPSVSIVIYHLIPVDLHTLNPEYSGFNHQDLGVNLPQCSLTWANKERYHSEVLWQKPRLFTALKAFSIKMKLFAPLSSRTQSPRCTSTVSSCRRN